MCVYVCLCVCLSDSLSSLPRSQEKVETTYIVEKYKDYSWQQVIIAKYHGYSLLSRSELMGVFFFSCIHTSVRCRTSLTGFGGGALQTVGCHSQLPKRFPF